MEIMAKAGGRRLAARMARKRTARRKSGAQWRSSIGVASGMRGCSVVAAAKHRAKRHGRMANKSKGGSGRGIISRLSDDK